MVLSYEVDVILFFLSRCCFCCCSLGTSLLLLLLLSRAALSFFVVILGDFRSTTLFLSLSRLQKEKSNKGSIEKGVASAFARLFVRLCARVCVYIARARVKMPLSLSSVFECFSLSLRRGLNPKP